VLALFWPSIPKEETGKGDKTLYDMGEGRDTQQTEGTSLDTLMIYQTRQFSGQVLSVLFPKLK
jgi:hypothetical protein